MNSHYSQGNVETIREIKKNIIRAAITPFEGYIIGNIYKYIFRHRYKGTPLEDISKAYDYLIFLATDVFDFERATSLAKYAMSFKRSGIENCYDFFVLVYHKFTEKEKKALRKYTHFFIFNETEESHDE